MSTRDTSEAVNRIKSILETIEQKNDDLARAKSGILRLNIELDRAQLALKNARIQLVKELQKFDPDMETAFTKEELEAVNG